MYIGHGEWSEWVNQCNCGLTVEGTWTRECNNPAPIGGGDECLFTNESANGLTETKVDDCGPCHG